MARMVNDVAPIVAQDADAMKSLQDEKKEIESKMGTAEYRKDEAMQARYRELLEIELKANKANKANAA